MKRSFLVCTALFILSTSFASYQSKNPPEKAGEIFLQIGTTGQTISLRQLSIISIKDYERFCGRHLRFFGRLSFKSGQKRLRNGIAKDGTVRNKRLIKAIGDGDPSTGFNAGGFALGLLLPLVGVLVAYLIGGDEDIRKNRVGYAWKGTALTIGILSIVAVLTKDRRL